MANGIKSWFKRLTGDTPVDVRHGRPGSPLPPSAYTQPDKRREPDPMAAVGSRVAASRAKGFSMYEEARPDPDRGAWALGRLMERMGFGGEKDERDNNRWEAGRPAPGQRDVPGNRPATAYAERRRTTLPDHATYIAAAQPTTRTDWTTPEPPRPESRQSEPRISEREPVPDRRQPYVTPERTAQPRPVDPSYEAMRRPEHAPGRAPGRAPEPAIVPRAPAARDQEWQVPRVGADEARGPNPRPADDDEPMFTGAIPAPIARLTKRLSSMVEGGGDWSQRFMERLEGIAGNKSAAPRADQARRGDASRAEPPRTYQRAIGAPPPSQQASRQSPSGGNMADRFAARFPGYEASRADEWSDAELIQDAKEATKRETSNLARNLLRIMVLFFVVFFVWAALFSIDEVTRGEGKVISSSQTQIMANLEGGIIREILVREGQEVKKDQPLARLDNAQALASLRDNRVKFLTLQAQVARLTAEVTGRPINFPPEVTTEAPDIVRAESALMSARLGQFEAQMQILRDQRSQKAQELADLRNKAHAAGQQVRLANEQLQILEPLAAEGLAPRVDVIRSQRDKTQAESDLEAARIGVPRTEAGLREADRKIEERIIGFRSEAQKELNERQQQLSSTQELQRAERDRVTRTELRAPMNGIVKQIYVKTVGGVVRPGQDLIEVVPTEDTLLVEVKIRPADVGFVRPGQTATVKVTAYDYSIYGSLDAVVEDISADSIVDERPAGPSNDPYFRVRLRTAKNMLAQKGERPLRISPGMVVTADILTGERTVLTYITKPLFKTLGGALGER